MRKLSFVLSFAAMMVSSFAFAAEGHKGAPSMEITGGSTGAFSIVAGNATGTVTNISGSVGFFVTPQLQIALSPTLAVVTGGGTATAFSLFGGVNYSFDSNIDNSVYAAVAPGLQVASANSVSSTNFAFRVAVGKRFPLIGSVAYSPELNYTGTTGSTYVSTIGIVPLQFSFLL